MTEKLVYSIPELATIFHMGQETVRALVRGGQIPGLLQKPFFKRKLLISKYQVDAFLAGEKLEDIKKRISKGKMDALNVPQKRHNWKIEESKVAEAYRLFNENPNWGWKDISGATGINKTTIRHIFRRQWGITMKNRKEKSQVDEVTGILNESNVTVTDLDKLIERVNNSIEEAQKYKNLLTAEQNKSKNLLAKCTNYAARITELQMLLAHRD